MKKQVDMLNEEIRKLEEEINDKKVSLKCIKENRDKLQRFLNITEYVRKYEEKSMEQGLLNLDSLVRIGETFEEWSERFGNHTIGGSDKETGERWKGSAYKELGYTSAPYIGWLIELDDERVKCTC